MGQVRGPDKVGALTESGGTISLAVSTVTIGGQQFTTTSSLTVAVPNIGQNTLGFVYAVLNSGSPAIVTSIATNSVGPTGFDAHKLVGAFYTDGVSGVFGSFVTIEGAPISNTMPYTPESTWSTNVTVTGEWSRNGENIECSVLTELSGVNTQGALDLEVPANLLIDEAKLNKGTSTVVHIGQGGMRDFGARTYKVQVEYRDDNQTFRVVSYKEDAGGNGLEQVAINSNTNNPFTFANNDSVWVRVRFPIIGFNNTPLKDL